MGTETFDSITTSYYRGGAVSVSVCLNVCMCTCTIMSMCVTIILVAGHHCSL